MPVALVVADGEDEGGRPAPRAAPPTRRSSPPPPGGGASGRGPARSAPRRGRARRPAPVPRKARRSSSTGVARAASPRPPVCVPAGPGGLAPPGDAVGRSADEHGCLERDACRRCRCGARARSPVAVAGHVDGDLGRRGEQGAPAGPAAPTGPGAGRGRGPRPEVPQPAAGDGLEPDHLVGVAVVAAPARTAG